MSDLDTRCLNVFPEWLRTLPDDVRTVASRLGDGHLSTESRAQLAGAVNYLFKSLDLVPDGIEDIGYVDDAFVLRVAVALALRGEALPEDDVLEQLASEAVMVREFLGSDGARLEGYVASLAHGTVRGRSTLSIVTSDTVRAELLGDLDAWVKSYDAPSFTREEKTLVRLKAFLSAKLP